MKPWGRYQLHQQASAAVEFKREHRCRWPVPELRSVETGERGLLGMSWVNMFASGLIWAFKAGAGGGPTESEFEP